MFKTILEVFNEETSLSEKEILLRYNASQEIECLKKNDPNLENNYAFFV